ncbi:hypothetical protein [Halomonas sp. MES3-P3E]|uniref:hypothetical protein n=1 Tax=Halomonas sp. MES3-P3E TaxID=2058321 RepID=UPI000C33EEEA|nr:hypothetical protein [Halomonas sp. MES3-P3E]PKG52527.1 hypothetical protein CXF87_08950 [Halomonas sp. MES3-P3E]
MKQRGAALVIVMALLSGALVLGVSGMNSALIDERLAGNYRASVEAQMNSDSLMSDIHISIAEDLDGNLSKLINDVIDEKIYEWDEIADLLDITSSLDSTDKMKVKVEVKNDDVIITTQDDGTNNNAVRETVATYRKGSGGNGSGGVPGDNDGADWQSRKRGIYACEKVEVTGSALLDSYDSEAGLYGEENSKLSNMELRTWLDNSNISTTSSAPIYGSIYLPGDFQANNSANVYGDIYAGKSIYLDNGGFEVYGDLIAQNDIVFQKTAKVYGNAYAGNDIKITRGGSLIEGEEVEAVGKVTLNGGADIDAVLRANGGVVFDNDDSQVFSDVYSPSVTVNTNNSISKHILGELYQESADLQLIEDLISYDNVDDCDVYDVASIYEQYAASEASQGDLYIDGYPQNKKVTLSGDDERFYGGEDGEKVMKVNDFSLAGNRELYFGEEGESNDFVVLVDGDLNINGYNSKLYISDGSTVTFVVKGKVGVVGQVSNLSTQGVVARNGQNTSVMNIVSLYDDRNKTDIGVRIRNSKFYADILAPLSRVEFANEAAYGAVYGREVSVLDYGGYHFDKAINVEVDESCQSESEEDCSGQNSDGNSFALIGWQ